MKVINLVFTFFIISCSSPKYTTWDDKGLSEDKCVKQFEKEKLPIGEKIFFGAVQGVGTGMSYTVTGLGHTTDVVLPVASGIIISAIVCSPLILVDTSLKTTPNAASIVEPCIEKLFSGTYKSTNFGLGEALDKGTKSWRCPNVDHLSMGMRRIANCYSDLGEVNKAKDQLSFLDKDDFFQTCLSELEKEKIKDDLELLKTKKTL